MKLKTIDEISMKDCAMCSSGCKLLKPIKKEAKRWLIALEKCEDELKNKKSNKNINSEYCCFFTTNYDHRKGWEKCSKNVREWIEYFFCIGRHSAKRN